MFSKHELFVVCFTFSFLFCIMHPWLYSSPIYHDRLFIKVVPNFSHLWMPGCFFCGMVRSIPPALKHQLAPGLEPTNGKWPLYCCATFRYRLATLAFMFLGLSHHVKNLASYYRYEEREREIAPSSLPETPDMWVNPLRWSRLSRASS